MAAASARATSFAVMRLRRRNKEGASEGAEVAAAGEEAVTDLRRESDAGGENL